MNNINLRKISENNFLEAFNLKLGQGQEEFVTNPVRSLAQAYVYYNQCSPFGIYLDDKMVGYVMIIYDYDLEEYNIWHMMIGYDYQYKGYGSEAMKCCLEYIRNKPFGISNRVVLTCNKNNSIAMRLYRKFGFAETGNEEDDEIEFAMELE